MNLNIWIIYLNCWWKIKYINSPPTNVARVRFLDSVSYAGMSLRAGYRQISPPKRDLKAGWNFNRAQILEAYFNGVQSKIAGCVYLMSLPSFSLATSLYMWVEFVVGSRTWSKASSPGTPVFLPPQEQKFPKYNSTWKQWREEPQLGFHWIPIIIIIIIKLLLFIIIIIIIIILQLKQWCKVM